MIASFSRFPDGPWVGGNFGVNDDKHSSFGYALRGCLVKALIIAYVTKVGLL